jgi:alpha-ribazole phosphatase
VKLWLVRHARPLTLPGTCYGRADLAADARSTAQTARHLARLLPPAIPVFSSPLRRCAALAEALLAARPDLRWQADPRLQEFDFGSWEGRRWSDIGPAEFSAWLEDFAHHRVGGGESVQHLMDRVAHAASDTRQAASNAPGSECAWITHAGVIRAATLLARGIVKVRDASQWPLHAPEHGCWIRIPWPTASDGESQEPP